MRILFDHGTPTGLAGLLVGHEITEAIERDWDRVSNGELLQLAEDAGFDVILTTDKRMRYQQNLKHRRIAVVALGNSAWRVVRHQADRIAAAVNQARPGTFTAVEIPY